MTSIILRKLQHLSLGTLLSVFGLGLLAPVNATAYSKRDTHNLGVYAHTEDEKRIINAHLKHDIEISILHGDTTFKVVPPRIIHPDLDLEDITNSEIVVP